MNEELEKHLLWIRGGHDDCSDEECFQCEAAYHIRELFKKCIPIEKVREMMYEATLVDRAASPYNREVARQAAIDILKEYGYE